MKILIIILLLFFSGKKEVSVIEISCQSSKNWKYIYNNDTVYIYNSQMMLQQVDYYPDDSLKLTVIADYKDKICVNYYDYNKKKINYTAHSILKVKSKWK